MGCSPRTTASIVIIDALCVTLRVWLTDMCSEGSPSRNVAAAAAALSQQNELQTTSLLALMAYCFTQRHLPADARGCRSAAQRLIRPRGPPRAAPRPRPLARAPL
jgi:hypothetical protein